VARRCAQLLKYVSAIRTDGSDARGTVAAPGCAPSAVTATINWGDGTSSAGKVTGTAPTAITVNSLYPVAGAHTYPKPGVYQATVTVSASGAASVTAHLTVNAP